jgi:hypothetical protein
MLGVSNVTTLNWIWMTGFGLLYGPRQDMADEIKSIGKNPFETA